MCTTYQTVLVNDCFSEYFHFDFCYVLIRSVFCMDTPPPPKEIVKERREIAMSSREEIKKNADFTSPFYGPIFSEGAEFSSLTINFMAIAAS